MSRKRDYMFTSESVTEGHPDKMADQISDAVLDAIIADDTKAIVAGEVTTDTYVEIPTIVRGVIKDIGYTRAKYGFDYETCGIMVSLGSQSPNIAQGVNKAFESRVGNGYEDEIDSQGAGDQGMMFGYACTETPEYMPLPIMLAHKLAHRLSEVRKAGILPYLRPDGKSQVSVRYENDKPVSIETIVVSSQHAPNIDIETQIMPDVMEFVVKPIIPEEYISKDMKLFVNPTGGAADRIELEVAYAIGVSHPVSVMVDTFGTEKVEPLKIEKAVSELFDLRPGAIVRDLDLLRPIYKKTAAYGHFGRHDRDFTWEKLDKVDAVKDFLGLK